MKLLELFLIKKLKKIILKLINNSTLEKLIKFEYLEIDMNKILKI